jgi:hypothetical protein
MFTPEIQTRILHLNPWRGQSVPEDNCGNPASERIPEAPDDF